MTDNILGKKRQYNPSRKAIVKQFKEDYRNVDPELRRLRYVSIRDTPDNREYCYWNSSVSQSFGYMTPALIEGDGLRVNTYGNTRAKELIKEWFENINVNYQSISDYICHTWIDEMMHGKDFWRVEIGNDYYANVDIQRLDPKTLTRLRDPKYGWTFWVQTVSNYKSYRKKSSFYRNARITDPLLRTNTQRTKYIYIPDEPDVILRNQFFLRPPISAAKHYIVYKRFILYFMRKYSQRLWSPLLFFLVGDPKTPYYPQDDESMQNRINDIAEIIPDIVSFSDVAMQGDVRVEEIGKNSARSSAVFVEYINMLDKQIMMSQFASMGLRDASGNELATSRTLKEMYLQFIAGVRRKYKSTFENFLSKCLCKANGIAITPRQLDIEFPPLKFEETKPYLQAIQLGVESGVFKDRNEVRKAANIIWRWLDDLPNDLNTKYKYPIENMIKQQTSMGVSSKSTANRIMQKLGK